MTAAEAHRGRPAIGPQVNISIAPDMLARVDEAAKAAGVSRSEWIRQAISARLDGPKVAAEPAPVTTKAAPAVMAGAAR